MLKQKLVHLDLKGAPPKINYIIKLLPIFKSLGATGLLVEYEDTFPYTGFLDVLKSKNHYSEDDLRKLFEACILNKLTVIPLIQSLGHLEFVLKHIRFKNLREVSVYPNVACPTNDKTLQLIYNMIEQIVSLHSKYIDLKYIHLGCDEVWHLAVCENCLKKCNENQWSRECIFLNYVFKLTEFVKNNYNLSPIIWDDMLRPLSSSLIEQFQIHKNTQLMIWHYSDIGNFQLAEESIWTKYLKLFDNIWIASAFKGAANVNQILPPIDFHINNHLAWLQVMKQFILSNSFFRDNLEGIVLTGWQRFDHFMTLCELLPMSIPSLALCLQAIQNNCFNEEAHRVASGVLKFNQIIPLSVSCNEIYADFPGSQLYCLSIDLLECNNELKIFKNHPSFKGGFTDYAVMTSRTNPLHIHSFLEKAKTLLSRLEYLQINFEIELKQVFDEDTVNEWLHMNTKKSLKKLTKLITECNQQLVSNGFTNDNLLFYK